MMASNITRNSTVCLSAYLGWQQGKNIRPIAQNYAIPIYGGGRFEAFFTANDTISP